MKRNTFLAFGILPASLLAARVTSHADVYSQGIYSYGHTCYGLCSTTLPFPPYHFEIHEICWQEDTNGYTILPFDRTPPSTVISRRNLEVYGPKTQMINLRLEPGPPRRYDSADAQSLTKSEGDLSVTLTQYVAALGGITNTNAPPTLKASWLQYSGTNEDIIVLTGDHFTEIEHLLEKA